MIFTTSEIDNILLKYGFNKKYNKTVKYYITHNIEILKDIDNKYFYKILSKLKLKKINIKNIITMIDIMINDDNIEDFKDWCEMVWEDNCNEMNSMFPLEEDVDFYTNENQILRILMSYISLF